MQNIDKLTNEELKELVLEYKKILDQKYGIYFDKEKNNEDIIDICKTNVPLLDRIYNNDIMDFDKELTNNIIIEGDNFHSLASLNLMSYVNGIVDIIYIDPPYNTGNNDFTYNDKIVNNDDVYRHTKWLSFMDKRLKLARNLMKEDAVIFISIDDNEQAQLKLLCDSIFGERNFIQMFLWNKNSGGSSLSKFTRSDYEYVICYAKDISKTKHEFLGKYSEGMGDSSLINKPNKYGKLKFPANSVKFTSVDETLVKVFKTEDMELYNDIEVKNSYNSNEFEISCNWKWQQSKLDEELSKGTVIISKSLTLRLRYIKDNVGSIIKPTKSIQERDGVGFTVSGSAELKEILGNPSFSFPKPTSLIKYLIRMYSYKYKNEVIMDFFAGSGTTAQAVLELNKEDGGNRKFIVCTNNENNIMEEVCYPRIKTVITGKRNDETQYSDGIESNIVYYKSKLIERHRSDDQTKYNMMEDIDGLLCVIENIFEVEKIDEDICIYKNKFTNKILMIYKDYFNKNKVDILLDYIKSNQDKKIVLYPFSTDDNIFIGGTDVFTNLVVKPIPTKIYNIYKEMVEEIKKGV